MKHRLLTIAFAFLGLTLARADYSNTEPFSKSGPFSPTGTLEVENINGDITVRTWDKNEILIEGVKSAKTDEELKRIELTMDVSESKAALKVRLPKREGGWSKGNTIRASVRFTITVPATARLENVETVNSSISVEGVRGPVNAETVNGGIRATDLGGDAHLETVNGAIRADFAVLARGQHLEFDTVNGQIVARLPKDAGFELRSSVVNGDVDCDFPVQLKKGGRRSINGRVGDGGASVDAEAVNGRIVIESR